MLTFLWAVLKGVSETYSVCCLWTLRVQDKGEGEEEKGRDVCVCVCVCVCEVVMGVGEHSQVLT